MFSRAYRAAVTVPPLLWVAVFLLVPYALLLATASGRFSASQVIVHSWTLDNYRELLARERLLADSFRSMWIAARVMISRCCWAIRLAYYPVVSRRQTKRSALPTGHHSSVGELSGPRLRVENDSGQRRRAEHACCNTSHLTKHPLEFLLYSPFAVVLTLTHIYTPFAILPIYASLEHIPRNLVEASHDLGASPFQTFWRVILPLSIPGVLAGATFAFVLSLGDFLAPLLLGGPSGIMISNIVVSLFGAAYNWPLGAAISFCMLVLVLALLFLPNVWKRNGVSDEPRAPCLARLAALACYGGLRISLSAHRHTDRLLLQRRRRGRISSARPDPELVSHAAWRRRHLDFGSEQPAGGPRGHGDRAGFGIPAALALDRANFPGKAAFSATGAFAANPAGNHYWPFAAHARSAKPM